MDSRIAGEAAGEICNTLLREVETLKANEVRMVDQTPRNGAHDTLIAFIHPKSSGGVLTELVQETNKHD